ncbi:MAG TPA: glycosyl hydrolase, partial [Armatimonadota bacterium]|nr:glycosyl hydrolase [Armatimonadota bacterium]
FHRNNVSARDLAPLVDQYGQSIAADWPDKIHGDKDLLSMLTREKAQLIAWGAPKGYDEFGGNTRLGWHETATGFFTIKQRDGKWWLISPKGNPCFFRGICGVPAVGWDMTPVTGREYFFASLPPKDGEYAKLWAHNCWGNDNADYVALQGVNLMKKFGVTKLDEVSKLSTDFAKQRLQAWGFSGFGKWNGNQGIPVLRHGDVPNLLHQPDVFDPAIRTKFTESLRNRILPQKDNPFIIGWSVGNEADEIISTNDIRAICKKDAGVPAKCALIDYALQQLYNGNVAAMTAAWHVNGDTVDALYHATDATVPDHDIEVMRCYYADRYYAFLYTTIKAIDPNHLYFGSWVCNNNDDDWRLQGKYCDVFGYDHYGYSFDDGRFVKLFQDINKPVFLGEFSYPTWHNGSYGFGRYGVFGTDDADAGRKYDALMREAAANPYCIGAFWFQYRDQPVAGRGPVNSPGGTGDLLYYGEHYAFGVVDVTDTPKWELVKRMRQTNLAIDRWRMKASDTHESSRG